MDKNPSAGAINIALIGKSGHGKSSTGNSILGENKFEVSNSPSSCTNVVRVDVTTIKQQVIRVIDTPGLMDTEMNDADGLKKVCSDMAELMQVCPNGIHVLVLTLSFGTRYTPEEAKVLSIIKTVFGPNFIRDYCVIVMTHGENYKDKDPFMSWCKKQQGKIQELFKECQYRIVLFKNGDNALVKKQCVLKLMQIYSTMESITAPYTNKLFKVCAEQRKRIVLEHGLPTLTERIKTQISLLKNDLSLFRNKEQQKNVVMENVTILLEELKDSEKALYVFVINKLKAVKEHVFAIDLDVDLPLQFQEILSMIDTPDFKAFISFIEKLKVNHDYDEIKSIIIHGLDSVSSSMEGESDLETKIKELRENMEKTDKELIKDTFNEHYPITVFQDLRLLMEKMQLFASSESQIKTLHDQAKKLLSATKEEAVGTDKLKEYQKEAEEMIKEIESIDPKNLFDALEKLSLITARFDPPTPLLIGGGVATALTSAAAITGAVIATVLTDGLALPVIIGLTGGVTSTSFAAATVTGIIKKIKKKLDTEEIKKKLSQLTKRKEAPK